MPSPFSGQSLLRLSRSWQLCSRFEVPVSVPWTRVRPISRSAWTLRDELGGPDIASMSRLTRTAFALSPDGRRLVFAAWRGAAQSLYQRVLDRPDAQPIPGTERALNPFFSPDGEWVAYSLGGQLWQDSSRWRSSSTARADRGQLLRRQLGDRRQHRIQCTDLRRSAGRTENSFCGRLRSDTPPDGATGKQRDASATLDSSRCPGCPLHGF